MAQEAMHNALRHADATRIDVTLTVDVGIAILQVTDNGVGFAPASTVAGRRLGLTSMRERAQAAGGTLTVTSEPGGGTTVRLVVPT